MFRAGKPSRFDFRDIKCDGFLDGAGFLDEGAHETRRDVGTQSQHVVDHQHLTAAAGTCTDADGGDGNGIAQAIGQCARNGLHQQHAGASRFKRLGSFDDALGSCVVPSLDLEPTHLMHRLRCQPHVGAHRDTATHQKLHRRHHFLATFDLDHLGPGPHQLRGIAKGFLWGYLRAAKRHVGQNEHRAGAACNAGGMVGHVSNADGQRRIMSLHHHAQGITHQQHFHACLFKDMGKA